MGIARQGILRSAKNNSRVDSTAIQLGNLATQNPHTLKITKCCGAPVVF
jgi:hypothetical protein